MGHKSNFFFEMLKENVYMYPWPFQDVMETKTVGVAV